MKRILILAILSLLSPLLLPPLSAQGGRVYELVEVWSKSYGGYVTGLAWVDNNTLLVSIGEETVCRGSGRIILVEIPTASIKWGIGLVGGAFYPAVHNTTAYVAAGPKIYAISIPHHRILWDQILREGYAVTVAISPNATLLAVPASDKIQFYDPLTGSQKASLSIKGQAVWASWSPSGWLAVGTKDGRTIIYDNRLNMVAETKPLGGIIAGISWSPDGKLVAVATGYPANTLAVYNATTGQQLYLQGTGIVAGVAWINNTVIAAALYTRGSLLILNPYTGKHYEAKLPLRPTTLAYSPETGRIAIGAYDTIILARVSPNGAIETQRIYIGEPPVSVKYNENYSLIAAAWGKIVTVYNTNGEKLWEQLMPSKTRSIAWSSSGEYLAVGGEDFIALYKRNGEKVFEEKTRGTVLHVTIAGSLLVAATNNFLETYSIPGGGKAWEKKIGHITSITALGNRIVVGAAYPARLFLLSRNGEAIWAKQFKADSVRAVAVANNTILIALTRASGSVIQSRIAAINASTGEPIWATQWVNGAITCLDENARGVIAASFSAKIKGRITREVGWIVFLNKTGTKLGETGYLNCPPAGIAWVNETHLLVADRFKGLRLYRLVPPSHEETKTSTTAATSSTAPTTTSTATTTPATSPKTTPVTSISVTVTTTRIAVRHGTIVDIGLLTVIGGLGLAIIIAVVVILIVLGRRR